LVYKIFFICLVYFENTALLLAQTSLLVSDYADLGEMMSRNIATGPIIMANDAIVEHFDWGRLVWFASGSIGNSDAMTLGRCIMKPGHENPRHTHPNCEELLQVISGRILHTLADESFEMGPGDTIAIPQDVVHNARNIGAEDAVLTIVFSSAMRQTQGEF
jgi:quercetin dioxygenase-like cupin family protein